MRDFRPLTLIRLMRLTSTLLVAAIAFAIPYMPAAAYLGFVPLPEGVVATFVGIAAACVATAEMLKRTARYGGETVVGLKA